LTRAQNQSSEKCRRLGLSISGSVKQFWPSSAWYSILEWILIAGLAFGPCLYTNDIYPVPALIVEPLLVQPWSVERLSEQNPDGLWTALETWMFPQYAWCLPAY